MDQGNFSTDISFQVDDEEQETANRRAIGALADYHGHLKGGDPNLFPHCPPIRATGFRRKG